MLLLEIVFSKYIRRVHVGLWTLQYSAEQVINLERYDNNVIGNDGTIV